MEALSLRQWKDSDLEQFTAMIERIQKGEKKLKRGDQGVNKGTEAVKIGPIEEEK